MVKRVITSIALLAFIVPIIVVGSHDIGGIGGQSFFLMMFVLLSFYAAYEINSFLLAEKLRVTLISSTIIGVIFNGVLLGFFIPVIHDMKMNGYDYVIENINPNWFISFTPLLLMPILLIFNRDNSKRIYQQLLSLLYLIWAFSFIFLNFIFGVEALIYPIFITVIVDTVGYFIGTIIGKHKIAPNISPNKSWEGTIGGVTVATLIGMIIGVFWTFYSLPNVSHPIAPLYIFYIFLITFGLAIFSFFGDLFFSLIKRKVGKKDYGSILPGHGGLMDRIDGHIFTTTIICIIMSGAFL